MIISNINYKPYKISFKSPFKTAIGECFFREGIIIKIQSGKLSGFGETAPLPYFSNESLIEARNCLEGFAHALSGINENQTLYDLLLLANAQTFKSPSALYGLETAIYDLFSKKKKIPLWQHFTKNCADFILVNGLENDIKDDASFNVFKIKLIDKNIFNIKEKIEKISQKIGNQCSLRIDANGSLDLARAIRLCKELENYNIDYIEQPLDKNELEDQAELRKHTKIPIAADESLTDIISANKIIENQSADIFIIKPMITGSFLDCLEIINLGKKGGVESVITTTMGTEIERQACIHLAFAGGIKLPCGLSTSSFKSENIIENPTISAKIIKPTSFGIDVIPEKIPYS